MEYYIEIEGYSEEMAREVLEACYDGLENINIVYGLLKGYQTDLVKN